MNTSGSGRVKKVMTGLKFRKMIQIMKNFDVKIDLNLLQKVYKDSNKKSDFDMKFPDINKHGKNKVSEEQQLLQYTFKVDKIPNKFSKFNDNATSLDRKKGLRDELMQKISLQMKRITERKLTQSMEPMLSGLSSDEEDQEIDYLPLLEDEALLPDSDKDSSVPDGIH